MNIDEQWERSNPLRDKNMKAITEGGELETPVTTACPETWELETKSDENK